MAQLIINVIAGITRNFVSYVRNNECGKNQNSKVSGMHVKIEDINACLEDINCAKSEGTKRE
jgi:retron-type reverse transcriptase